MASGITVRFEGVERLQRQFDKLAGSPKLKSAVVKSTAMVLSEAKHLAPPGTGALRNSIHMTVEEKDVNVIGRVFAGSGHAAYVEFGTGVVGENSRHPTAVKKGFKYAHYSWTYPLPVKDEKGNDTVRFVTTSGYRARPFMYPALKQNEAKIKRLIVNAINEESRS